jgi:hypothetical protein
LDQKLSCKFCYPVESAPPPVIFYENKCWFCLKLENKEFYRICHRLRYIQSIIERAESLPGKLVGRKPPGSSNPPSAHQSPMKAFIEIYEQPRFPSRIPLYQNKKVRFK